MNYRFLIIALWTVVLSVPSFAQPVVIGYVAGYGRLINTEAIEATKLTHLNYAFVDLKDSLPWLHYEATDTVNFHHLVKLKEKNPNLKILISIGGWSWSKGFSDAVLSDSLRTAFSDSAVALVSKYALDGVDIDWEYPNMPGEGNAFRPEDRHNYTLLFQSLRTGLDSLEKETHRKLWLTAAVGGFTAFLKNTEMDKAQHYLDYINLMTYDYAWEKASHHTNLYASKNYEEENSADKAVKEFMAAGVPARKLVMGLAFYGPGWILESAENRGLNQPIVGNFRSGGYTYIKDSLVGQAGYRSYWDRKAKAPYLFQKDEKKFISYENERSVKEKCRYVKRYKLGGVMFWEYFSDPKGYLLAVVNRKLR